MTGTTYRRYVLGALTVTYTVCFVDRGLISLFLQSIKEDLQLSDTQLGFITGIAFGLFYATLGVPIARLADRGNRSNITAVAVGLWAITVMSCLLVANFVQLVAARVAAAIGEAGCLPPTYSLLGDYFPDARERARAMSVYWMAPALASLASFAVGGWLAERYGWRVAMFLAGGPGILIAILFKLTVAEPRANRAGVAVPESETPPILDVVRYLWHRQSCRHLSIAVVLLYTMSLGLGPWYATFMIRSHGMPLSELGIWLGIIFGGGGVLGTLSGGYVVGRWFSQDERVQMRLGAVLLCAMVPFFVLFLLAQSRLGALTSLPPLMILNTFILGPAFALMQRLVPENMRASSLAVVLLFANLIGMGIGPQLVGTASDLLAPTLGNDSLRYAMLLVSLIAIWSAYHLWMVGPGVKNDLVTVGSVSATRDGTACRSTASS